MGYGMGEAYYGGWMPDAWPYFPGLKVRINVFLFFLF
jgi:hypothetical protein